MMIFLIFQYQPHREDTDAVHFFFLRGPPSIHPITGTSFSAKQRLQLTRALLKISKLQSQGLRRFFPYY